MRLSTAMANSIKCHIHVYRRTTELTRISWDSRWRESLKLGITRKLGRTRQTQSQQMRREVIQEGRVEAEEKKEECRGHKILSSNKEDKPEATMAWAVQLKIAARVILN